MKETLEGAEELCFPHLLNSSCRRSMHHGSKTVFLYILLSTIAVVTVILNLLVIISISHFRQLQTQTNLILLSLAASDLLIGLVLMPVEITLSFQTCWFLGDIMCAIYCFLCAISSSASVGSVVLISIDRYVAICDPLHYSAKVTHSKVTISVCSCWISCVLYNCLIYKDFLRQPDMYNSCYGECVVVFTFTTGLVDFVVTFIVPVAVIIVLYMRVFVVAISQARAMRSHITAIQPGTVTVTAKKSERKAAKTLGIIIVVFCMCLFPFYLMGLSGQDVSTNDITYLLLAWLWNCNSCLNPVIYSFFYPWFRESVKLIVTLKILRANSSEANVLRL